jgi:hypothetical protein
MEAKKEVIIIYSSYTDAQKRAIYKYVEKNKEKHNKRVNESIINKYKNNEEFKEKVKQRSRDYYNKKCLEKKSDLEFLNSFLI